MKRRINAVTCLMLILSLILSGCGKDNLKNNTVSENTSQTGETGAISEDEPAMVPVSGIMTHHDYLNGIDDIASGETINKESIDYSDLDLYFTASESGNDLMYLKVLYNGYDSKIHVGELAVNKAAAEDVLAIMKALFLGKYEISKMQLEEKYRSAEASMEDDNTAAFNPSLTSHSNGFAIDINPFENPTVTASGVKPEGSTAYAYRESSSTNKHMIDHNDLCYRLFRAHGWSWGGDSSSKEYQHFEIMKDAIPSDPDSVTIYPVVTAGTVSDSGIAQDSFDLIDSIIQSDVDNGFPGAQLAVIKDEKLIYSKAWGKVNAYESDGSINKESSGATVDTLYDLASNTKMYSVNYAIQYLVTQGMLTTDMKVSYILGPDFADDTIDIKYDDYPDPGPDINKKWKNEITVKDLLCHQAGFPADPQYNKPKFDQEAQGYETDKDNILFAGNDCSEKTRQNTLKTIFRTPLMYEPGTKTLYSDVDYMLLGFIVEKVTGERLDTFCDETFYAPLGLTKITFNPLLHGFTKEDCAATELNGNTRDGNIYFDGIRKDTVQGEVHDEKAWYCMGGISGHAGLFSNAEDLAKLASVMITGGYGNDGFFSEKVIEKFTSAADSSNTEYGLGWWRQGNNENSAYFSDLAPSDTVGHEGWTGTLTMIDRKNDLVIVLLTNKRNTKITDPSKNLNIFDGNWYTTASLNFVPQLIYQGMKEDAEEKNTEWLNKRVEELHSKSEKYSSIDGHPVMKAYKAIKTVKDQRNK